MKDWKREKLNSDKYNQYILAWRAKKLTLPPHIAAAVENMHRTIYNGSTSGAIMYTGLDNLIGANK